MSAVSRASSSAPRGAFCFVDLSCPNIAQAFPSDTPSSRTRCSTQTRRRAGLTTFPTHFFQDRLLQRQVRHRLAQPRVSTLELLQPLRLVELQPPPTPSASDNTSAPSPRSPVPHRPPSCRSQPEPPPVAASRRYPEACAPSFDPFPEPFFAPAGLHDRRTASTGSGQAPGHATADARPMTSSGATTGPQRGSRTVMDMSFDPRRGLGDPGAASRSLRSGSASLAQARTRRACPVTMRS